MIARLLLAAVLAFFPFESFERHGRDVQAGGVIRAGSVAPRAGVSTDFATHGLLRVNSGARYLEHADGTQFPFVGDTAWSLLGNTTLREATDYLEDRRSRGYNVILISICEIVDYTRLSRNNGVPCFTGNDVTTPNSTYFSYADAVVDVAAAKGIAVAMVPIWGNPATLLGNFDSTKATAFGNFLRLRYASKTNIIWVMGGDLTPNSEQQTIYSALATALGSRFLRTSHPAGETTSSSYFQSQSWFDFSMAQSGHSLIDNSAAYTLVHTGYAASPTKPTIDAEPRYENSGVNYDAANGWFEGFDERQAQYWGLFSGAFGVVHGNHVLWYFERSDSRYADPNEPRIRDWQNQITMEASRTTQHIRELLDARPFFCAPDQTLVTDDLSGAQHIAACKRSDYAFIYTPYGDTFRVNFAKISGASVKALV
jgi:hypothetical protein